MKDAGRFWRMKLSRILLVIILIIIIGVVAVVVYEDFLAPSAPASPWLSAASYPLQLNGAYGVSAQQCVVNSSQIYCVGGIDANSAPRSEVYYSAPVSSTSPNITGWTQDSTSYPQNINLQSCVTSSGYVYCVGGSYDDGGDDIATSYYASLNATSLGSWNPTTAYPVPTDTQSCVSYSSYIYCIGGYNETDGTYGDSALSNSVWYANLSSSGIGAWTKSTPYPSGVFLPSCVASANYVFCVGGSDSGGNPLSNVYYATLSSTGVGPWTSSSAYPTSLSAQACVISSGFIYCVGGEGSGTSYSNAIYYAPVSLSGVGTWKQAANYPDTVATDCVASSGYLYCIGGSDSSSVGETPNVYYYPLSSISG
jgi:Kelch motif